ncbi:MAG: DUF2207 domain-containing protein, partial [Candidatus Krumholzibacteria bacterium]|nr:DUF2207 domain-containing protein [Candidatus Krumholzibacteria bacterium]
MRAIVMRTGGAILLAAAACAATPAASWSDKSYFHPDIAVTIALTPGGAADVEEIRSYRFDGSFSWAYLKKAVEGQYGRYRIEYLDVSDAETGERLPAELSREGGYEIVTWRYSAKDETRRFRIRYRVHDAVQRYGDAAQLYWKVIGEEHERISRLSVTLRPPAPSASLLKVFVHGPGAGELDIADDRSSASVRVGEIERGRLVEIRALMDPSIFHETPARGGESHASLLEDERRITEQWRMEQERRIERSRRRGKELAAAMIIGAASVLALAAVFARFFGEYGREYDAGYAHRYERQPPRDIPPCYIPAIMTQSGARIEQMGKAFVASLLECARLGCLEIREREKGSLIFKKKELEYELTGLGRKVVAGGEEGLPRPLTFFERDVLEAVFVEAGDGSKTTGEEIRKWAAERAGSRTNFYQFVEEGGKRLRRELERL